MNFEDNLRLHESILSDRALQNLYEHKHRLLNQIKPTYILDKENNTLTPFCDGDITAALTKINENIECRIEQIKRVFIRRPFQY
jgi:hypothetical protein